MSEHDQPKSFPLSWLIAADYDPNEHIMSLKGRDYLNVQHRMIWFVRDQRKLTADGLATTSYAITTECIELDREAGFAHFRTTVRDVLGNEATMYGSETAKDFGDYVEKASTKSLGRALAMLGYGTQFAPEMDEEERVVDTPMQPAVKQTATSTSLMTATAQLTQWCEEHGIDRRVIGDYLKDNNLPRNEAGAAEMLTDLKNPEIVELIKKRNAVYTPTS